MFIHSPLGLTVKKIDGARIMSRMMNILYMVGLLVHSRVACGSPTLFAIRLQLPGHTGNLDSGPRFYHMQFNYHLSFA